MLLLLLGVLAIFGFDARPSALAPARVSGPLEHSAYLWQRRWSTPVHEAIDRHAEAASLGELLILAAELDGPEVTKIAWEPEVLKQVESVGLTIRVGGPEDPELAVLLATTRETLARARAAGLEVRELQIDYDAASLRLAAYARWIAEVREAASPTPVTITALPDWLSRDELPELLGQTDGWVLQVHGLRPMTRGVASELLDVDAARAAVERAGAIAEQVERPFRVALPTYAYLIARDPESGEPLGLAAEQAPRRLPRDRFLRAAVEPAAVAALVAEWTADRPAMLRGIAWFRLPVAGDRFAWSWPSFMAVVAGRAPDEQLELRRCLAGSALIEVSLRNAGEADLWIDEAIPLDYADAAIAGDGLGGFVLGEGELIPTEHVRLSPGEQREIAWLRFATNTGFEGLPACP